MSMDELKELLKSRRDDLIRRIREAQLENGLCSNFNQMFLID
jgi:hypothetical protein